MNYRSGRLINNIIKFQRRERRPPFEALVFTFMEVWKKIEEYPDYEISTLGRIKSLKFGREKILKGWKDDKGYIRITLFNSKVKKNEKIHQLMAITFLNHKPCGYKLVVNHKNLIRNDNRLENLEVVTARENTNQLHLNSSSQYLGVSWYNYGNKNWRSRIMINGKQKSLGYYKTEIEASNAYQKALSSILLSV